MDVYSIGKMVVNVKEFDPRNGINVNCKVFFTQQFIYLIVKKKQNPLHHFPRPHIDLHVVSILVGVLHRASIIIGDSYDRSETKLAIQSKGL